MGVAVGGRGRAHHGPCLVTEGGQALLARHCHNLDQKLLINHYGQKYFPPLPVVQSGHQSA